MRNAINPMFCKSLKVTSSNLQLDPGTHSLELTKSGSFYMSVKVSGSVEVVDEGDCASRQGGSCSAFASFLPGNGIPATSATLLRTARRAAPCTPPQNAGPLGH